MAKISSSLDSQTVDVDQINNLNRQIRQHEVAIEELNNLPSTRSVYVKKSNIFFRTSIKEASASEKRHLDSAKRKMQNHDVN